jgi:2-oxoglutarate ferredoxin oxidoreductase subunit alpha
VVSRSALSAVKKAREKGIKAGLLRLITLWPFPERHVAEFADRAKRIVVPELNYGQIVREVERVAKNASIKFLPKLGEDLHTPSEILKALEEIE